MTATKTGDRCTRCGTVLGTGGKAGRKLHGWNTGASGTVACHKATPKQLAARRAHVLEAEKQVSKAIDRTVR